MDSILNSVKKMLGIDASYTHFDQDLIMHINSALFVLTQIGVGREGGFSIEDARDEWGEFVYDLSKVESVKTYVYLKVRLMFDPPTSSAVMNAINQQISELEWRLSVAVEPPFMKKEGDE